MKGVKAVVIALLSLPALIAAEPDRFHAGLENRMGLTFTPDGQTAFWVEFNGAWGDGGNHERRIYRSDYQNDEWSAPAPALSSGPWSDDDPFVSPDGRWLYFASDRPIEGSGAAADANIWRFELGGTVDPEPLPINSSSDEYSPVVTQSGALYFASSRSGGPGRGDIWVASAVDGGFSVPKPLGPAVNSATGEWNLWVSPDEKDMIFEASSRATNVSVPGDLYYSWHTPAGWSAAVPVRELNTTGSDLMPRLSPDGNTLYFTSAPIGGHAAIETASWPPIRAALRADYAPELIVANRSSHEVTIVDLKRAAVTARLPTGPGPHLLSNVSDNRMLATAYGLFPEPHDEPVASRPPFVESLSSRLTLIDVAGKRVLLEAAVDDCARPHASWIVEARAFVTCEDERSVLAVDLDDLSIDATFDTGQDGSHVLAFDPASRRLGVTNTGSGSLTLIDIDDGETSIVALGAGSEGLASIDGSFWVGNAIGGSVAVVHAQSAKVLAEIDSVCGFPIALGKSVRARIWVACFTTAELVSIDPLTHEIDSRIELVDQPLHVLLHPRRNLAYVSLPRKNAIAEIDLDLGEEVRRVRVGIEPDGLRWATDGSD